jgi:hypothetical protein
MDMPHKEAASFTEMYFTLIAPFVQSLVPFAECHTEYFSLTDSSLRDTFFIEGNSHEVSG